VSFSATLVLSKLLHSPHLHKTTAHNDDDTLSNKSSTFTSEASRLSHRTVTIRAQSETVCDMVYRREFLVGLKTYRHFFLVDCHIGMVEIGLYCVLCSTRNLVSWLSGNSLKLLRPA